MTPAGTPSHRLAQSRERLRRALNGSLPAADADDIQGQGNGSGGSGGSGGAAGAPGASAASGAAGTSRARARFASQASGSWWQTLAALPGAGIVGEAARQWWLRHPLRTNILLGYSATQALVQPVAQRHPLALVAGAFVLGAVVMRFRPLRGLFKPVLLAGLLPQLLLAVMTAKPKAPGDAANTGQD